MKWVAQIPADTKVPFKTVIWAILQEFPVKCLIVTDRRGKKSPLGFGTQESGKSSCKIPGGILAQSWKRSMGACLC